MNHSLLNGYGRYFMNTDVHSMDMLCRLFFSLFLSLLCVHLQCSMLVTIKSKQSISHPLKDYTSHCPLASSKGEREREQPFSRAILSPSVFHMTHMLPPSPLDEIFFFLLHSPFVCPIVVARFNYSTTGVI